MLMEHLGESQGPSSILGALCNSKGEALLLASEHKGAKHGSK